MDWTAERGLDLDIADVRALPGFVRYENTPTPIPERTIPSDMARRVGSK